MDGAATGFSASPVFRESLLGLPNPYRVNQSKKFPFISTFYWFCSSREGGLHKIVTCSSDLRIAYEKGSLRRPLYACYFTANTDFFRLQEGQAGGEDPN